MNSLYLFLFMRKQKIPSICRQENFRKGCLEPRPQSILSKSSHARRAYRNQGFFKSELLSFEWETSNDQTEYPKKPVLSMAHVKLIHELILRNYNNYLMLAFFI